MPVSVTVTDRAPFLKICMVVAAVAAAEFHENFVINAA
jgi:hypothetical protein